VSCNPSGAPPLGNANLYGTAQNTNTAIPPYSEGEISSDGSRVFFETQDALVPQDTNGLSDVYEWESGRVYLISSGQGMYGSFFAGASSDGDNVFLLTSDHLAPQDIESSTSIYDARVAGGFVYTPFTSGCNGGQCQGSQTTAPSFGAPASATFVGVGNQVEPAQSTAGTKTKPNVKPKARKRGSAKRRRRRRKSSARRSRAGKKARRASRHEGYGKGRDSVAHIR